MKTKIKKFDQICEATTPYQELHHLDKLKEKALLIIDNYLHNAFEDFQDETGITDDISPQLYDDFANLKEQLARIMVKQYIENKVKD